MELAQTKTTTILATQNNIEENHEKVQNLANQFSFSFALLFLYVYSLLGVVAFIWSILCFDKKGSLTSKIFGFIIAVLLGPFYFFYYYYNKKYCRKR